MQNHCVSSTETESGTSTSSTGAASWAGWLAALIGLWVLITPWFWGAPTAGGGLWGGGWLFWSNIISGIVIAILAGYAATTIQSSG